MKQVKVGVGFGLFSLGLPSADTIAKVAERAEDWGLDSFWLSDHLLAPTPELDVVATLSLLASRTSRIRLGPSVFLLNLRHPLVAAKSFASLDYLSNGRMVMAVGTGANLAEYELPWQVLQLRECDDRAATGATHQQRYRHDRYMGRRAFRRRTQAYGAACRRLLRIVPDAG